MDFNRVETPAFYPAACLCGNIGGPQIDTGMENPLTGHVYLCQRCVLNAGRKLGMVDGDLYSTVAAEARQQEGEIAGLRAELAIANSPENKVVTVAEAVELAKVIQLDAERAKRRPKAATTQAS